MSHGDFPEAPSFSPVFKFGVNTTVRVIEQELTLAL